MIETLNKSLLDLRISERVTIPSITAENLPQNMDRENPFSEELSFGEGSDFASMEEMLSASMSGFAFSGNEEQQVFSDQNNFLNNETGFVYEKKTEEIGDFAKVKRILTQNVTQVGQLWAAVQNRAAQIQAACCPPGQSTSLPTGSFEMAFARPSLIKNTINSKLDKEDHPHCPKCGADIIDGVCATCST